MSGCLITLLLASVSVNAQVSFPGGNQSPRTTIGLQEVISMTQVKLDGRTLFTIAGMSPRDSQETEPLHNRAEFIEESLYKLLQGVILKQFTPKDGISLIVIGTLAGAIAKGALPTAHLG